ncbi:MAG TPA: TylF/MycF/NovP-related O-methyltransferase [Bacteroidales bacterium]|nr:TylF/MycF/NovP-related O-methyltransferase [Bacteroidales bacterium]HPS16006.1 TylF/MycF/NovP-related O-methyltransferase [Bacteroidales bacterium]
MNVLYSQVFQYIAWILIAVVVIIMIRYFWLSIYEKSYYPEQWSYFLKKNKVPETLVQLEKAYDDKIRFYNFWFQVERLKNENIKGSFAELGVYKGETAKIIHEMDKSRKLFLFDTFEGFKKEDLKNETGEAATYSTKNFADTHEKKVLEYINGDSHIIIKKGHFPGTTEGLEKEVYAFVNIDADLYNSIKEGCNYFYPRLSPGGVMIIHDYNHKWEGAMKAVNEFVKNIPENLIEIADMHGSVMIIKNKKLA